MNKIRDFSQFKEAKQSDSIFERYYDLLNEAGNNGLEESKRIEFAELHEKVKKRTYEIITAEVVKQIEGVIGEHEKFINRHLADHQE